MTLDYFVCLTPVILALLAYFIRLERILAKLRTDMCWIKKRLEAN
jgi:hypothetical protein